MIVVLYYAKIFKHVVFRFKFFDKAFLHLKRRWYRKVGCLEKKIYIFAIVIKSNFYSSETHFVAREYNSYL